MLVVDFVDAQQNTLLILAHIGETFEVYGHGNFEIQLFEFGDRVRDQIVMVKRADGQFNACHAPHLLGPKASGIDHMFGVDRAFLGHDLPAVCSLVQLQHPVMLYDFGAVFLGGSRIGVHCSGGVDVPFAIRPHAAEDTVGRHDRTQLFGLFGADQPAIVDADGLECPIGRL